MVKLRYLALLMLIGNIISILWFGVSVWGNTNPLWFVIPVTIWITILLVSWGRLIAVMSGSMLIFLGAHSLPFFQMVIIHQFASYSNSTVIDPSQIISGPNNVSLELYNGKDGNQYVWANVTDDNYYRYINIECRLYFPSGNPTDKNVFKKFGALGNSHFVTNDDKPRLVPIFYREDIERYRADVSKTKCSVTESSIIAKNTPKVKVDVSVAGTQKPTYMTMTNLGDTTLYNIILMCRTNTNGKIKISPSEIETLNPRDNPPLAPNQTIHYVDNNKRFEYIQNCEAISATNERF